MPQVADGTQSIRRAIQMMRVVGNAGARGTTLAAISTELQLSRSTTHRILQSMVDEHVLRQDSRTQCYFVGPLAFELGAAEGTLSGMVSSSRPMLERIAHRTNSTVYLVARSGYDSVCLDRADSNSAIRAIPVEVGQRRPLGIGAGSIAMLAKFTNEEIQMIFESNKRSYAKYPGGRLELILEKVQETRATGFSHTEGMAVDGVTGVGFAFPSLLSRSVLALSVAAVTIFTDKHYVENVSSTVIREVAKISPKWFARA